MEENRRFNYKGNSSAGMKGYIKNIEEANRVLKNNGYKFSEIIIFTEFFCFFVCILLSFLLYLISREICI